MLKFNSNKLEEFIEQYNLNTSHVKVQQKRHGLFFLQSKYLNTSHVKVQLGYSYNTEYEKIEFKYISC